MCWYLLFYMLCTHNIQETVRGNGDDYRMAAYFGNGGSLYGGTVNEEKEQACGIYYECKLSPSIPIREWWGEDDCNEWVVIK